MERGRLDSVSVAGIAVFSALAIMLAALSQFMGLNFPLVPYLQFDLGEVAIILAFFLFGPLPAVGASFVEFGGLLYFGQNIPVGPALKLFALLSTVGGIWLGTKLASKIKGLGTGKMIALGLLAGSLTRAAVMTLPNYYILVFMNSLGYAEQAVKTPLSWLGYAITDANALTLILAFTAVFNVIQLAFAVVFSYGVLRFPPVANLKVGGRAPWFVNMVNEDAKEPPPVEAQEDAS